MEAVIFIFSGMSWTSKSLKSHKCNFSLENVHRESIESGSRSQTTQQTTDKDKNRAAAATAWLFISYLFVLLDVK